jgi:hypothetical protein
MGVSAGCADLVSRVDRSGNYVAETHPIQFLRLMVPMTGQDGKHVVDHCFFQTTPYIHQRPKRYSREQHRETGKGGSPRPGYKLENTIKGDSVYLDDENSAALTWRSWRQESKDFDEFDSGS